MIPKLQHEQLDDECHTSGGKSATKMLLKRQVTSQVAVALTVSEILKFEKKISRKSRSRSLGVTLTMEKFVRK